MSLSTLAYARRAYQSFSRSARHLLQLIAGHQNLDTGWAYLSYDCLSIESSLTRRRVMQLVAFLEENNALEVRRGIGRGHVNFYRLLREEDGAPVPTRPGKKTDSSTGQKVKFPTLPPPEKVKFQTPNTLESFIKPLPKVIKIKEKERSIAPAALFSLSPEKPENLSPFWCNAHGFSHSERLPDQRPDCWQ
jgi:hypothetical protein